MLTTRFRFALVAATLFAVGLCPRVYSSENPFKFVGRWRSDEGRLFNSERYPSGYWVIDRYPSGHYGKRQYLVAPEDGSLEMSVEWGQWAVRRGRYYETPWGTTSSLLKGWVGEPRAAKILDLTKKDFTFLRGQLRRRETRIFDDTKLLLLSMPPPSGAEATPIKDTIQAHIDILPSWATAAAFR